MDLLPKLEMNLKAMVNQRDQTRTMITKTQDDLKELFAKSPKKPRGSMSEIDKNLTDLETQRTRTSLSLTEEKQLMKRIFAGERDKRALQERIDHDKLIDSKKAQVQEMRKAMAPLTDKIADLEKAVNKAKLAAKIGCTIEDMQKTTISCPSEKMGKVIGKSGAMIKKIEEKAGVSMDVDTDKSTITIHGSDASIADAQMEINKIVMAAAEELELPQESILYLTTASTGAMSDMRQRHPDMYLEVARNTHKFTMRGQPEQLAAVKQSLQAMGVAKRERELTAAEAVLLIGKKGANIEKITSSYKVAIEVSKKSEEQSLAIVAGAEEQVESAMKEIEDMIAANAEVTKLIPCGKTVVQGFLTANGVKIKDLQKKISESTRELGAGSVSLSFDKATGDNSNLVIKGKQAAIGTAVAMVGEAIREIDTNTIRIMADRNTIPQVIGKGGENIKKLKGDKKVNIEVDRKTGEIAINGLSPEEVAEVEASVLHIIAENKILKVPVDPALIDVQYRELIRQSKVRTEVTDLAKLDIDKDQSAILLRGTDENVGKAAEIVKKFLTSNYMENIDITDADRDALLSGGQKSKIVTFAKELEVNLSANRETSSIQVKGSMEKVKAAVKKIKAYLYGGEGNTCHKILCAEEALGLVIGKGGQVRKSLEAKYEGVTIYIHRTNDAVTIRGPEENANNCRFEVLKLIASGRITQEVKTTEEKMEAMNKNNLLRRTAQNIPVQLTVEDTTIKVRGVAPDVKHVVALINEQLTGVYESILELGDSQFAKIKGASRDESHFARMKESTAADILLNDQKNAVVIRGKRNNVKKAKFQVFDFLEFLVPGELCKIKLPKTLNATVGQATALIEVASSTGTSIWLDRDVNMIIIESSESERMQDAKACIQAKVDEAERLLYVFEFDTSEAWLIPIIIGVKGGRINSIRKQSGCTIVVSKEERTVVVSGTTEEDVTKAKSAIQNHVDQAKKENAFVDVPADAMARFVGKGGAHISELRKKYEVEIETSKKGSVKITGSEDNVLAAKKAVEEWVEEWAKPDENKEVKIQRHHISPIIGKQGANIQAMQEEFGCRIDLNREDLTVKFRGDPAKQELALRRIEEIMAETPAPERPARAPKSEEESAEEKNGNDNSNTSGSKARPQKESESSPKKDEFKDPDEQVDRTSEFPALPVGLTPPKRRRKRKSKAVGGAAASPTKPVVSPSKSLFAASSGEESSVSDEDDKIVARDPSTDTMIVNISA
ncbi:High density lipoprotein binding protein [Seminavis robusta]|uniref:High density lipoprotein binding protein n=1 Tax=Seminavis robusta TaxID=568900 RepID=A0A9N8HDS9_9STRA|nr:High density lipoprotein binding protein [Seminavis robusta]|eukprot:Sro477_g150860.1 High density lipoprotein binding protein (1238) ;mRNA; f:50644-54702